MFRFSSAYGCDVINNAVNTLIENNDAFRLHFTEENGYPVQAVIPHKHEAIPEYDMQGKTQEKTDTFFKTLAQEPFTIELNNMYRFAAVKFDGGQSGIFFCLHHLICDAWSISLIGKEILHYLKQNTAENTETKPKPSFLDAVEAEQRYITSTQYEKDKVYWDAAFIDKPQICRIKEINETRDSKTNGYTRKLDNDFCHEINEYCIREDITPAVLFETAVIVYLHRTNEYATPVTIGVPVLNRYTTAEKNTIGMFISTAFLSVSVDKNGSIKDLQESITEKHIGVFRHQKYPISNVLQSIRAKDSDFSGMRDVVLSYQNARIYSSGEDISVSWYPSGHSEVPLCVHIEDLSNTGNYRLHFDYQTAVLSDSEVTKLCDRLLHIIRQMMDKSTLKVKDIQIMSPDEYRKVIHDFNDTAVEYPKDKCIHQLFEEQVKRIPDSVAVVFEEKEYTYRQINEMANSLAHILREKGVGRDDIVAIVAKRSYKIIVAQLAILKAGGAFMFINPGYPKERIDFMLNDAGCKVILTYGVEIEGINMDDDSIFTYNSSALENVNVSDDLCYVIFTSGSTGQPKATMLTHKNFVNFCDNNNNNNIQVTIAKTCNSFFCLGEFVFDMASAEVYLALLNNHKVILPNDDQLATPEKLAILIKKYDVDFILTTPTRILSYLNNVIFAKSIEHFKVISLGGEILTVETISLLKKYTNAIILNGYGPAETTQGCTWTKIDGDISIGMPIANTQTYILDKNLTPLPIGVAGELCISGDGVGRGYLNRPELTAERFVPNPFIESSRMYKTGDLARWREDGQLEYIGRIDNQIKLRGIRIELGEIESEIAKFEGIKQIAVVDKKDETGRQYICAYYTADGTSACDETLDESFLRTELAKTLPRYMIPHFFTQVDSFPTTTSGKTDRKSFPEPDFTQTYSNAEYSAPVTKQEKALVRILEAVLGVSPIGMNDDFFDIGGDSLKVIEYATKAQSDGIHFEVQDVFEYPTPAALINRITRDSKQVVQYNADDFDAIHWLLKLSKQSAGVAAPKSPIGDVIITGATGWLGVHVLDEFLSSEPGTAYCLVRGTNLLDSQNKLTSALRHYFGDKHNDNKRIIVVCGDITDKILLEKPINTIIHNAANVKHYGAYKDSYNSNVIGTKNMIALAKEKDALLVHISTASVSGNSFNHDPNFPATVFDETKLYIGQPLENVYVRSKFEAETAVLEARSEGLDAVVIRVGNLANRRSDLMFQKNHGENATLSILKAFADLGVYPRQMAMFPIELSPVDDTARAIIKLTQHYDKVRHMFHTYHDKPIQFINFVKALKSAGIRMKAVSVKRFLQEVSKTADIPSKAHIYENFVKYTNADGSLSIQSNIKLCNRQTARHLNTIGFNWSKINRDYLSRYIEYFQKLDYLGYNL
jgi:amino acid adenylation domain-containing protein/thioester reductase-like protein